MLDLKKRKEKRVKKAQKLYRFPKMESLSILDKHRHRLTGVSVKNTHAHTDAQAAAVKKNMIK